ncbi:hypothetical protein, partial [Listeria monocytogenes]|uniref:hypothetical protein n=1 Tax=Listeria monocytogenes TaxID=1639 RepID=UPI002FDBDC16
LVDWDFRSYSLVIRTAMGDIRDCLFGQSVDIVPSNYLDVYQDGSVNTVEYCTFENTANFDGVNTVINQRVTGTPASPTFGAIRNIRFNR